MPLINPKYLWQINYVYQFSRCTLLPNQTEMENISFADLLPADVVVRQSKISNVNGVLLDNETLCTKDFNQVRLREFTCGRILGRQALKEFGINNIPILQNENGLPIWPNGTTGSITHKLDFCVVAVGSSTKYRSIGVDLESASQFDDDTLDQIASQEERFQEKLLVTQPPGGITNLLFSAKESVYKCLSPIIGEVRLDFLDVNLTLSSSNKSFRVEVDLPQLSNNDTSLQVNFIFNKTAICTSMVLRV